MKSFSDPIRSEFMCWDIPRTLNYCLDYHKNANSQWELGKKYVIVWPRNLSGATANWEISLA